MRPTISLAAAIFALAGCAATSVGTQPVEPIERPAGGMCDPRPVQYHVGHQATQEMGAAILAESGAKLLRWGPPNSAWTMDYREDRVNIRYNENMTITYVTCG